MKVFGTRDELSIEDLKKLGLDPEKLVSKDDLTNIKTELGTSMTDIIKAQFADLETKLQAPKARTEGNDNSNDNNSDSDKNNNNNSNNNNNNNNMRKDVTPMEFLDDPIGHTRRITGEAMTAVALQNFKLQQDFAYERANEKLPGFQNAELKAEIDKEWKAYEGKAINDPFRLLTNLHDMVMGRHRSEIETDSAKREGKYNIIQGGGSTSNSDSRMQQSTKKPEDQLTPKELTAAKNLGITPEEYLKSKGELSYV